VPVYTALSMMTHPYNRRLILETDCDFAALHQCLASLPKHSCQVGYKVRPTDGPFGMDNDVITYMSDYDDEEEEHQQHGRGEEHEEKDTRIINTSYLEEEQSQFDDDTIGNETGTFCTLSSFPTSVAHLSDSVSQTGGSSIACGSLVVNLRSRPKIRM